MLVQVTWRHIEEFPHYLVSSEGSVCHEDRELIRKWSVNKMGFPIILLTADGSPQRYLRQINNLVAKAFLEPAKYRDENSVWHKDGNLLNCHADNLKWDTRSRVLEWNDMHRRGEPKYKTPRVKNNQTGVIYPNAYECGLASGEVESKVLWVIERQAPTDTDDNARFRYIF